MFPQLKRRMNQEVHWQKFLQRDGAGDPVYAPVEVIKGYLAGRVIYRTSNTGEQIYSQQTFFVDETLATRIQAKDLFLLPGGLVAPVKDTQLYYSAEGALDYGEVYL